MAHPEHLKILKRGVKAWNKWRKENPDIKPDLSKANLKMGNLWNLRGVDFTGANLRRARLFYYATLTKANLRHADLSGAELVGANLHDANLMDADFSEANLTEADLQKVNLFCGKLRGVKLKDANLRQADLFGAKLSGADLSSANLNSACIMATDIKNANLKDTDLRFCHLIGSNLSKAILTGAKLYGTARDNWIIRGVECKYVYWDMEGKQRSPKDRDFERGEFEQIYVALPFFEYVFEHGMSPIDPLIMDRVVQAIREKRPEFNIKIDSINARGLAPSIKFTVQQEKHKKPALKEVRKGYEERINRLEAEKDRLYNLLGQAIDKSGIKLITAGPGAIVATDGSTINIQQHIHNALELQRAIAQEPEDNKSFTKVAKKKALDIIGGVIEDIAKGQVKEAAKEIIKLGKDLGPIIAKTAAYAFFKSMLG